MMNDHDMPKYLGCKRIDIGRMTIEMAIEIDMKVTMHPDMTDGR